MVALSGMRISPNERNHFPAGMHPVELGAYTIITASIFKLFRSLCKWMVQLRPGCIVHGRSRVGKSHSILALTQMLPKEFPGLRVLNHDMKMHEKRTEKQFYRDMLVSFEHEEAESGDAAKKVSVIIDFLTEEAFKNQQKRIVIFIDEAQWLTEIEYGYLRGVYNSLVRRKIIPMFVLVGDEVLKEEYKKYRDCNNHQITGRFMSEIFLFEGLKSEEEVRLALNGYDITEAPSESGWSFTRYFFPMAYECGWRLASQAKTFWGSYCEAMNQKKVKQLEIFMSDFTPVVENFLCTYNRFDVEHMVVSPEYWKKAFTSLNRYDK